jgi:hypothetical protein
VVGASPGLRRRLCGLLAAALLLPTAVTTAAPLSASEAEVKAAFLFNFGKFVEWPPSAFEERAEMVVCVVGDDSFADTLDGAFGGKKLHERPLRVERPATAGETRGCHILFIDDSRQRQLPEILRAVDGQSTLTVGDTQEFAAAGTIIGFTMEENKVRFVVNSGGAERAGLKISSQLLKLAVHVIAAPNEEP